jgi:GNAT superfamily N-acetyltransferase
VLRAGEVAAPLQTVFDGMSTRSRYLRYHTEVPRLTAAYRTALTTVDGVRHVVLAAERPDRDGWIADGLGRLIALPGGGAEVALEVVDAAQRRGIGGRLLRELVALAEVMDFRWLMAAVVAVNTPVLDWLRREFPESTVRLSGPMAIVTIPLAA